jgi:hypothetical protein
MALQKQTISCVAGLPIDTSTRRELTEAGKVNLSAINMRQDERGAQKRRRGFSSVTRNLFGGSSIVSGRRLTTHKDQLLIADGSNLYAYSPKLNQLVFKSALPSIDYELSTIPTPTTTAAVVDAECCNGYSFVAHANATTLLPTVTVVEQTTGSVISVTSFGGEFGFVWLGSYGSRYVLAFFQGTTTSSAKYFDTQNPSSGWTTFTTGLPATAATTYSVCSLTDRVAVGYGTSSGGSRVTIKTFNIAGILETRTLGSGTTPTEVSVDGSISDTLWAAWTEGNNVRVAGVDADALATDKATVATALTTTLGAPVRVHICEYIVTGDASVVAVDSTAFYLAQNRVSTVAGVATPVGQTNCYDLLPAARPFRVGVSTYLFVYATATSTGDDGNVQAMLVLADITSLGTSLRPVANIEPGLIVGSPYLAKVPAYSSTERLLAFQSARSGVTSLTDMTGFFAGTGSASTNLALLDFGVRPRALRSTAHEESTFFSGAITHVYDGHQAFELGMVVRPGVVSANPGAGGSPTFTATNVRYVALFEDIDASGNLVVSGASNPSVAASVTTGFLTVTVRSLTLSARFASGRSTPRVAFYRTTDNGTTYYRVGTATNDLTTGIASLEDRVSNAVLINRPLLFGTGSLPVVPGAALDRRAPKGLQSLVSYNGMLVGARGSSIFSSGQSVYGEATWFSPVFETPVPQQGGDITALAAFNGTLFIFKENKIFVVSGEAPSDNGLQGGLGTPREVVSDIGCIDENSIVVTAMGVVFRSRKSIEIISSSFAVEPIGDPMQALIDLYPEVTSAAVDDLNNLLRITLGTSKSNGLVTGEGRTIVFDLLLKYWVSEDNIRGSSLGEAAQSACMVPTTSTKRYAWLSTDGTCYIERAANDATPYLDGSSWIDAQYEVPPIKGGLLQDQRVFECMLLFERASAAGLVVEVANDFGTYAAITPDRTWTESATVSKQMLPFRVQPSRSGNAVQLRIRDTAPAVLGTGQGLIFVGLGVDIAPKPGITSGLPRVAQGDRR